MGTIPYKSDDNDKNNDPDADADADDTVIGCNIHTFGVAMVAVPCVCSIHHSRIDTEGGPTIFYLVGVP